VGPSGTRGPKQVDFCLHQKDADFHKVRKLAQIRGHYLSDAGFFCAEWEMT
jgi:hypothetical protein